MQGVLLAFFNVEGDVRCSLCRVVGIVLEVGEEVRIDLNVAARAVKLLQIIDAFVDDGVAFNHVARLEADHRLDFIGGEFGIVFDFDIGGAVLAAFINRDDDLQALAFVADDGYPRTDLADFLDARLAKPRLQVTVVSVNQHAQPIQVGFEFLFMVDVL